MPYTIRPNLVALCAALATLLAPPLRAQSTDATLPAATARVIVKFKSDSSLMGAQTLSPNARAASRAQVLGQRLGLAMGAGTPVTERSQVVVADGITSDELAQRLAQQSDVEYAIPDRRKHRLAATNDPLYGDVLSGNGPAVGQGYLRAPTDALQSATNVEAAWAVTTGNQSIVVAVLDTGVRFDHPDLRAVAAGGNLLAGYDMISDVPTANDGDGRDSDASDPGDWLTDNDISRQRSPLYQCAPYPEDSSWHGTQVSGLIAALTNNGVGMASVGRTVRVLPVRVLGKCGGYDSDIIAAMRWAAGLPVPGVPANPNRAQVINMSLGGIGSCNAAYQEAVNEVIAAGTVIVAAAGNTAGHAVGAPANCTGIIAVGALRHVGTKVGFSDLGPDVAISAPGGNCINVDAGTPCLYPILTTSDSGTTAPAGAIYTDSYNASVGTSFSAPLVAGTVALMLSAQPALAPSQVKSVLQATARPFPTTGGDYGDGTAVLQCAAPQYDFSGNPIDQYQCYCTTSTCGAGMLDAGAAVSAMKAAFQTTPVVEYYWAARDHYFVTANPAEIAALDASPPGGWTRTGQSFSAYTQSTGGANPVCRFYIPATWGDSHYFSASPAECAAVAVRFPMFTYETSTAFYMVLPDATTGACPAGTVPVYRVWDDRADTNHRYTTSMPIRNQMVAKGYVAEGYGPNLVSMCAPQ